MPSRDLKDAEPVLAEKFTSLQRVFETSLPSWRLIVSCTLRSDAEQLVAFLSHHSKLDPRVASQRRSARHLANANGKSEAVDAEIYSRASGLSADRLLALKRLSQSEYDLLYFVLQLLAELRGLRSGGDWNQNQIPVGPDPAESFVDPGHFELQPQ